MRKWLCWLLAAIVLLGGLSFPRARAEVNYSTEFEDAINMLRWNAPYWDIQEGEAFPTSSIINYTKQRLMCDAYGEAPIEEGEYTFYARYAIPADVFEAAAQDFFGVVNVESLRSYTSFFWDMVEFTGIDDFQNYQEDRGVYLFSNAGGMGDSSYYQVMGYTWENQRYTVYSRLLDYVWGQPEGVEGQDYVLVDGEYFEIVHYLETVMTVSNGRVQFHSWKETRQEPEVELTTPLTQVVAGEAVNIWAADGVFPEDVTIAIDTPEEAMLDVVERSLKDVATKYVAYDFTASAQPDGTAQVSFAIPEGFDPEQLALIYIDADGNLEQLEIAVDTDQGIIIAQLSHFSVYAVVQLLRTEPMLGDVNGDGKLNVRDVRLIMQYIAGLIDGEALDLTVADYNGDSQVNVRDVRMMMRWIAGLE